MVDAERLNAIKLVVYDFDGVMTDNRVLLREDGLETVLCTRADGHGVDIIRSLGLEQAILSTEPNPVVQARAGKLRIRAEHGCADKGQGLRALARDFDVTLEQILFVGNDTNDLPAMALAGLSVGPADAHPAVLDVVQIQTAAKGGAGVVRELADMFLAARK